MLLGLLLKFLLVFQLNTVLFSFSFVLRVLFLACEKLIFRIIFTLFMIYFHNVKSVKLLKY